MEVVDLHCDVVYKLLEHADLSFDQPDGRLDVTVPRLREGNVILQVFALFLPDSQPLRPETLFRAAERYVYGVLAHPDVHPVDRAEDIQQARASGKIGAIFSLEGADALQGQWWALRLLRRLGVRLLGPTWNRANWACDGAMEPRGGGLTKQGKQLIAECEALGIIPDVSHLSERGFWDVADAAAKPFFASHSNAHAIRAHPRNLTDDQIKAIIAVDGIIGLTFVPWFLTDRESAKIDDVLRHVEHVCALGGHRHLAFGSDFDGIDRYVRGLEHPGQYGRLAEALLRRYTADETRMFLNGNAKRFLQKNL